MSIKQFIIICVGAIAMFSCEKDEVLGPDLEGIGNEPVATSEFSSSVDEVNLTDNTIYFTQEFEKTTVWQITLQGLNSGAIKTLTSSSLSISEENSEWDGLSDSGLSFQVEDVVATLSFPYFPSVKASIDTFTITGITGSVIKSVLFSDFEVAPLFNFGGNPPVGGGWGSDWPTTNNTNTAYPLYDANAYLFIEGAPWQANNPYVDITEMPASVGDTLSDTYLPLYSSPDRVYLNLAVYNTGTENTWLQVQMIEDNNGVSESRGWNIRPDWIGWKNISIKYSDLITDFPTVYNPSKVKQISLVLLSDQDTGDAVQETVSIAIDRLEFSFDAALGSVNY